MTNPVSLAPPLPKIAFPFIDDHVVRMTFYSVELG